MLKYRVVKKNHSVSIFEFDDKQYALLGEFLLAECRNFGPEIVSFLAQCVSTGQQAELAGNVFRIEASEGQAKIVNDITNKECSLPITELKTIIKEYMRN